MKRMWGTTTTVAAFAALLCSAPRANAVSCSTSLADTTNVDCVTAAKCQKAISTAAAAYTASVQKAAVTMMTDSQTGKITTAPVQTCSGGPNSGKPCGANNGVCKLATGSPKGKVCNADTDCGGAVGSCDRTKGCNPTPPNDVHECAVSQPKTKYTKDVGKAQATLLTNINKACLAKSVAPSDIGLDQITDCPKVAAAATDADAYSALADCIKNALGGDFASGNLSDSNFHALTVSSGTGALPPKGKTNKDPRQIIELQGSQALQIGGGTADPTGNNLSPGGTMVALNAAHCVGGNGNAFCVNNADCGTDAGGFSGTCTENPISGGEVGITGAPVHQCCASGADTGKSCVSSADCASAATCSINSNCFGNTLAISATCGNGIATCLITHTRNSGNGTTTIGSMNLTSGHYSATSPILTDVYVINSGVNCATYKPCPICNTPDPTAGPTSCGATSCCANGSNTLFPADATSKCDAPSGQVTTECPIVGVTPNAQVPNPFTLTDDPKSMSVSAEAPIVGGNQVNDFCGFCDTSSSPGCQGGTALCSTGCGQNTVLADCGVGNICDFSNTQPGFHGDTGAVVVTAPGVINQYTPFVTGLFCTGITGNATVDGPAGASLPGPVRVTLPYIFGYVQTKDP